MEYADLVEVYERLEETASTLEKTAIVAETLQAADDELSVIVKLLQGQGFRSWKSTELGVSSSLTAEAIVKATGIPHEQVEDWWRSEGDLGDAARKAVANKTQQTLFSDPLTVKRVHDALHDIAAFEGKGSQERRIDTIAGLLSDASPEEARFIVRTIVGAMRLGIGEGIIRDAIAKAFLDGSEDATQAVQRGFEVTNDYVVVATRARDGGRDALADLDIELFRPIKPMLAQKADDMAEALNELASDAGTVLLETKYDGIRAKLHSDGDQTKLFTRRLEDVTTQFPDVIDAVNTAITAEEFIIEAEIVGYDPETDEIVPFQTLSQRIKRKYDIDEMAEAIPVTVYVFDLLYLNGESLLSSPLQTRLERLTDILSPRPQSIERAQNIRTASGEEATSFYESVVTDGHEGVMAKNLDAAYQPGTRVGYQLKVKSTMEPLDLVVTRAKWSEGRKSGFLGRPYLACYDEETDEFREVGRMHTGFTDEQLATFTDLVEPLIQEVNGREAVFDPQVVLEVEYEEIQESSKYDSGYALRFPRLLSIREDLAPRDADRFRRIQSLYADQ